MDVKVKVRETIISLLKIRPTELKDDVRLCDGIGVDSTEMVEMVISLEKALGIKLSVQEVTKFCTVNDIEKIIKSKMS